jgi:hypothetical protein
VMVNDIYLISILIIFVACFILSLMVWNVIYWLVLISCIPLCNACFQ